MLQVNSLDLSIIILCYKSQEHLKVLLPSVFGSKTSFSYEVIVVDNGSNDGTEEWLTRTFLHDREKKYAPGLSFIRNGNNGFAHGNNLGIKQSRGRYILILNPDTKLEPDTLQVMLEFMETHPEVGMGGCKIIKPDGSLDLACRRRFPNPANSFKRLFLLNNKDYNYSDVDVNQSMKVDSLVGAFMMVRREVVEKIGLLDEKFFMYGEDLDWCWRCKEAGYKVWYYPKTFITHYKGASSRKIPFRSLRWFHDAMWIFYQKHYAPASSLFLNGLVYIGIKFRLYLLLLINSLKSEPRVSK